MDQGVIVYLIISAIMMCWALTMCIDIKLSGDDIRLSEIFYIAVLTFLFWWALMLFGIAYVVFERKFIFKRRH